jgi:hypothetical protein
MPVYDSPKHGAALSWAYLEAATTAPVARAMLHTFELYHPLSGRHRFVADQVDLLATLEAGAPADAGIEVEWMAAPLTILRPEESDTASTPQIAISLDNVAGLMGGELRRARGSLVPWMLTERVYASDDTTGPAVLPPTTMLLNSVDLVGDAIVIHASFGDPANVNVPALTFKRSQYPGLVR